MNRLMLTLLGLFALSSLCAETVAGVGEDAMTLWNAELLGTGSQITSGQSVFSELFNPAASGDLQRTTINFGYTSLLDISVGPIFGGQAGALGVSIPTRFGVFSGSTQFQTSSISNWTRWGTGEVSFSIAKDVYRDFFLGLGIQLGLGSTPSEALNWSAGLSLGFVHSIENLVGLSNFKWGASIRNMGKPFDAISGTVSYPQMFTLSLGAEFLILKSKDLNWKMLTEISFPAFQNLRGTLATQLNIGDFIILSSSVQGDLNSWVAGNPRSLIPTLSIQFNINSNLGDQEFFGLESTDFRSTQWSPTLGAAFLTSNVLAVGLSNRIAVGIVDTTPPQITIEYNSIENISPNNDGKKDSLVIPFTINDERFIQSYVLTIKDSEGMVIRTIRNKDFRPESNDGLQDFFARLLAVKEGIPIPEFIRWDGIRDDGSTAPDGEYTFNLTAVDDNLNKATSPDFQVVVDTVAPAIFVAQIAGSDLIFSPDDDGNKDIISLVQNGSEEDLWQMEIANTLGTVVRKWKQESQPLSKNSWDGKDDLGQIVPDGVYIYRVYSTDRSENSTSATLSNIIVNTQMTPIALNLEYSQFSPNNNGTRDKLPLLPNIPVKDGVSSWLLEIKNSNGSVQRKYEESNGSLPSTPFNFDGKSDTGKVLPDGVYSARLSVTYLKGNNPQATSSPFTIDTTAPQATVILEGPPVFSPGEGNRTDIPLIQTTSTEEFWEGVVLRSETNTVMRSWRWNGLPPSRISWNGTNQEGRLVEDGEYIYVLRSTDRAGNPFETRSRPFVLDTKERQALVTVEGQAFSPNGDGEKDRISLFPRSNILDGLSNYTVTILNQNNDPIRTFKGNRALPESLAWDGLDDKGRLASEEQYRALLQISFENGQSTKATSSTFILDITPPTVTVKVPYLLFSPNGDGKKDTLSIQHTSSKNPLWTSQILNSKNEVIKTLSLSGELGLWDWDGKNEAGNRVVDGIYSYQVLGIDEAGNRAQATIRNIQVDSRTLSLFLTLDKYILAPGQPGDLGEIKFSILPSVNEQISSWSLGIFHRENGIQKEFKGSGSLPPSLSWNGVGVSGALEGIYTVKLNVEYLRGDLLSQKSTEFLLDRSPPVAKIEISPEFFSPDNDGQDDELEIRLQATDASGIEVWTLDILDPQGKNFRKFEGKGQPTDRIVWDGRSSTGELVQSASNYRYILTLKDIVGHTSQFKGIIPVDILVIKDGNRLKIQIPSITFTPNSPNLLNDESEESKKNIAILDRIAQILGRFPRHNVRVEGHAVSVHWANKARALEEEQKELLPLSLSRAETVRQALIQRSVDETRLTSAGLGGTEPVVPHSDLDNRWKNRRVEFILVR